jgi:hypothetical protein
MMVSEPFVVHHTSNCQVVPKKICLSAVFDRLIKTHISLRFGDGNSLRALWELSWSSLRARCSCGYIVLTGEVDNHPANNKYGEVHTGDAWLPARDVYCQNKTAMSVGLILFGDKSHTDLHGALSLTPIIFTLTLFNRAAQNDSKFWRPIGYIPNLGYGRGTSNKTHTRDKIQDEQSCISFTFQSLKNINKENGFQCVVLGRTVHVKVWINFLNRDTEGNNKWLGQYPGNREGVRRLYHDCKCQFHDLSNPNPNCIYLAMDDINLAKKIKQEDEDAGIKYYRLIFMYVIRNALTEKSFPLSDNTHGH